MQSASTSVTSSTLPTSPSSAAAVATVKMVSSVSNKLVTNVPHQDLDDSYTVILIKSFAAGGLAGMISKTTIAPLDRIKILLQGHNSHYANYGVISGLRQVIKKEGLAGWYKGNGAMMIRVFPYAATQFVSFDFYKKAFTPYFQKDSHLFKLFAGSAAGINAVVVTYPLDLVRARLAFVVKPKTNELITSNNIVKSPGVLSTLIDIGKNEGGIKGLYRGLTPTLCHVIPYAGLNFYCFERVKSFFLTKSPDYFGERKNNQVVLSVPGKLIAGGIAGSVAQTIAYPFDVCRRRMQLSFISEETKKYSRGVISTLTLVYKEHGISRGLFRGMTANYIRAAPMISVNFAAYELIKQSLGLKTGIDIKT